MMSEITSWSSMAIHRQLQPNGLKAIDENQAVTRIVRTTHILGVTGNSEVVLDFVRKPVSCPGAKIKWAVNQDPLAFVS
jgi:hypothetical protein